MMRNANIDIFGNGWIITRREDSGFGFELLYGKSTRPDKAQREELIVNAGLRDFMLANLDTQKRWDLPVGGETIRKLRRIISSHRYRDLQDWLTRRDPSETTFPVHPDYIKLPPLKDVDGNGFDPFEIAYYRDDLLIWHGRSYEPLEGRTRVSKSVVLTTDLAAFLNEHANTSHSQFEKMGLPLYVRTIVDLRGRAVGYYQKSLLNLTANPPKAPIQFDPKYVKGAKVMDVFGKERKIYGLSHSKHGDVLYKSFSNTGDVRGYTTILTPEIAAILEDDQSIGSNRRIAKRLGVNVDMVTRMRRRLGHAPVHTEREIWWSTRIDDLITLLPKHFVAKHGLSPAQTKQMRYTMKMLIACANGERHGKAYIQTLQTDRNDADIAEEYGFKTARTVRVHKKAVNSLKMAGKV